MFLISEAFLHLREMIFRVVKTDFIQFPFPIHPVYIYILLVYKDILFDILKLKLSSIDPEYCVLFTGLLSCD